MQLYKHTFKTNKSNKICIHFEIAIEPQYKFQNLGKRTLRTACLSSIKILTTNGTFYSRCKWFSLPPIWYLTVAKQVPCDIASLNVVMYCCILQHIMNLWMRIKYTNPRSQPTLATDTGADSVENHTDKRPTIEKWLLKKSYHMYYILCNCSSSRYTYFDVIHE